MTLRVVGSPQAGRLLGQASVEAFTETQRRRSGVLDAPPSPPPSPDYTLPKVIYVPLPPPPLRDTLASWHDEPRVSTEVEWARRLSALSDDARAQCGLPPVSPRESPLGCVASRFIEDLPILTAAQTSDEQAPLLPAKKPTIWKRLLRALGCLRGR